jgi:hypothetical protein
MQLDVKEHYEKFLSISTQPPSKKDDCLQICGIFTILLFCAVAKIALSQNGWDKVPKCFHSECLSIFWGETALLKLMKCIINFNLLKQDRHSTLIINSDDETHKTSDLFCTNNLPVVIGGFNKVVDSSQQLADFDSSNSAIFLGSTEYLYDEVFPKLKHTNPKQKSLVILTDFENEKLEKILSDSHKTFDLSRFYLADYSDFVRNSKIKAHTYDVVAVVGSSKVKTFNFERAINRDYVKFDSRRYKNWNKNPMRVFLSPFSLASKIDRKTNDPATLGYMDGEILRIFSLYFNFTLNFISGVVGSSTVLPNGTAKGSLGLLEYGKLDLDANARIVMDYGLKNTAFIYPIRFMPYVFTLPKKSWKDANIMKKSLEIVGSKIYILCLIITLTVPIILFTIDKFYKPHSARFIESFLTVFSISMSVSTRLSKRWSSRWVLGSLALAFVVMGTLFSSLMVEFFYNASKYQQDIYTIDQLLNSDYDIKTIDALIPLFEKVNLKTAPESHVLMHKLIMAALRERFRGDQNAFAGLDLTPLIRGKKTSIFMPLIMVDGLLGKFDDDMIYLKETPYNYFVAMTIRKQLPMLEGEIVMAIWNDDFLKQYF